MGLSLSEGSASASSPHPSSRLSCIHIWGCVNASTISSFILLTLALVLRDNSQFHTAELPILLHLTPDTANIMSQCYFPDGSVSPLDKPCNLKARHSSCCRPNDICLDNGYCLGGNDAGPNVLVRTTCTDSTFNDRSCAQFCKDVNPNLALVMYLFRYQNPSTYCCGPADQGIGTGSGTCLFPTLGTSTPFLLQNGNMITNRTTGEVLPLNSTALLPDAAAQVVTVTTTPTSAPALSASTNSNSSRNIAIGAGVGVPLGLAFLAALTALLLQRRKFKTIQQKNMREIENLREQQKLSHGPEKYLYTTQEAQEIAPRYVPPVEMGTSDARANN